MAILLDEERQEELNENEEYTSVEETQEEINEQPEETPEETVEDDLPDKYRGKSPAEIARMHQEAEKLLGRQSSEVGELRKIVDDFVKTQLEAKTAPEQSEDDELDWYTDPEKAVARAIENHPKLKQAEQVTAEMQKAKTLNQLKTEHPDFMEIVQDPSFQQWVEASKIRTQLLTMADQQYDLDAANELLSTWKERKQAVSTVAKQETAQRKQQVKSASTGNASGSGEAPTRKIYRRADIIKLMQTDPDRYMTLSDEIAQAYAEGRVR
jgi:exosome complex component RRP41